MIQLIYMSKQAADVLEAAVEKVLDAGFRTPDIMQVGARLFVYWYNKGVCSMPGIKQGGWVCVCICGMYGSSVDLALTCAFKHAHGTKWKMTGGYDPGRVQADGTGGEEGCGRPRLKKNTTRHTPSTRHVFECVEFL